MRSAPASPRMSDRSDVFERKPNNPRQRRAMPPAQLASGRSGALWRSFDAGSAVLLPERQSRRQDGQTKLDGAVTTKRSKLRRAALAGALGFTILATFAALAGERAAGAGLLPAERLPGADPRDAQGRARAHDRGGGGDAARRRRRVHRCAAAGAAPQEFARRMSSGGTSRGSTSPAACGCPTRVTASSRPSCSTTFGAGSTRLWPARARPLVFYCLKDCWMSWNAAKRALELGYKNVDWYPEGSDGWAAAGLPLEKRTPEPRP